MPSVGRLDNCKRSIMKSFSSDVEAIDALHLSYKKVRDEIAQVIIGQDEVIKSVLISMI